MQLDGVGLNWLEKFCSELWLELLRCLVYIAVM